MRSKQHAFLDHAFCVTIINISGMKVPHIARKGESETYLGSFQTLCTVFCTPTLSKDASEKKDWRILGFFLRSKKICLLHQKKASEASHDFYADSSS